VAGPVEEVRIRIDNQDGLWGAHGQTCQMPP